MVKRHTQHRRRQIIDLVNHSHEISVDTLAQHFGISAVTIRKDLATLEAQGLLRRHHGGARASMPSPEDNAQPQQRQSIAQCATLRIRDHSRILIDSGRTTSAMLPLLRHKTGLVIMTNSLDVANALRELESEPTLLMTGGTWDVNSESFQGQLAETMLRAFDFDQMFIGADGIDSARGTTTYNERYHLSRVMTEVAREVVVVAESAKTQRKIPNLELPWSVVDTLITDRQLSEAQRHAIAAHQVDVILA